MSANSPDGQVHIKSRGSAVLFGNGINRAAGNDDWAALLDQLRTAAGSAVMLGQKPFPLYYESLYLSGRARGRVEGEFAYKTLIAEHVQHVAPNVLHERLAELPVDEFLTTNYDFALEKALGSMAKDEAPVRENVYSLFRRNRAGGKRIWHVHGGQDDARTIMLGHHHYAGYLSRIEQYVHHGADYANYSDKRSVGQRLGAPNVKYESWIDVFLSHDVHIVGFGFNPVEFHLWWLLALRRRKVRDGGWRIDPRIYFWTHHGEDEDLRHLLDAHGVTVRAEFERPSDDDWPEFYSEVLQQITRQIG